MTFVDGGGLLTKSDLKLGTVADLADKRIAIIPGTTTETALGKFLKEEFTSVKYVPVKNHVDGLAAVEKGSAEAFASDRGILVGLAITSKDPNRYALPNIFFSYEPYGFMVRRMTRTFVCWSIEHWPVFIARAASLLFTTDGSDLSAPPARQ